MTETVSDKFMIFLNYVEEHSPVLRHHKYYGILASEMLEEIEKLESSEKIFEELLQLASVWQQQSQASDNDVESTTLMQCVEDIRFYVQAARLRLSQNRSDTRRPVQSKQVDIRE